MSTVVVEHYCHGIRAYPSVAKTFYLSLTPSQHMDKWRFPNCDPRNPQGSVSVCEIVVVQL